MEFPTECDWIERCISHIRSVELASLGRSIIEVTTAISLEIHSIICAACSICICTLYLNLDSLIVINLLHVTYYESTKGPYTHAHLALHHDFEVIVCSNGVFALFTWKIWIFWAGYSKQLSRNHRLITTYWQSVQQIVIDGFGKP